MIFESVRLMPRATSALFFILAATFFVTAAQVQAQTPPSPANSVEGMHIHRLGSSAHSRQSAEASVQALEAQCRNLQTVCALLPATAKPAEKAACRVAAGGFQFNGNLADVGKQETDEYFATTRLMAVRKTKRTELRTRSACEVEVAEHETVDIRHYAPAGYTRYEMRNDTKKGRYWIRSEHRWVDPKAGAMLAGMFPMSDASKVSPPLGHKTYARHRCEVREVTGPWAMTLCVKNTGIPFPRYVTLAAKITSPASRGVTTLLEEEVDIFSEKLPLPLGLFFPPAAEKVESARSLAKSQDNPTQKWCAAQKKKTGINPCEDDPDDDEH